MSPINTRLLGTSVVALHASLATAQVSSPTVAPGFYDQNGLVARGANELVVCDINANGTPSCASMPTFGSGVLSSWTSMGGQSWSSLALVYLGYDWQVQTYRYVLFARGTDDYIYFRQFRRDSFGPIQLLDGDWQRLDDFGTTHDGIAAVAAWRHWNDTLYSEEWREVHVFVRGVDDAAWDDLFWSRLDYPSPAWTNVNGTTYRAPAAVFFKFIYDTNIHDTRMSLFVIGTDDSVWFTQSYWSRNWRKSWYYLGHPASGVVTSAPAATVTSADYPCATNVYARGSDNQLWGRTNSSCSMGSGTWSDWYSLGGQLTSGPGAYADPAPASGYPHEYILVRGTDYELYLRTRNPDSDWRWVGAGP